MTDYEALRSAYDIYMIKNVMGRHAYHHALGDHRAELDEIWSARDDISWGNNMGFWVGRETVYNYYADAKEVQDEATLKLMAKANPKIEVKKENFQLGALLMHSLTTPLIQVAADGKTAQGMWYSLGQVTNAGPDGKASGQWMHERYAVDFIREGEDWKIWHFFVGTDLGCEAGKPFTGKFGLAPGEEMTPEQKEQQEAMMAIMEALPKPTIPMELYHCKYGWHNEPHFPRPYATHTAEISYGPEKYL